MSVPQAILSGLSKGVQELRFAFCQTSPASAGLREFVTKNYNTLKSGNPRLPILVREASGAQPKITARFGTRSARLVSFCADTRV